MKWIRWNLNVFSTFNCPNYIWNSGIFFRQIVTGSVLPSFKCGNSFKIGLKCSLACSLTKYSIILNSTIRLDISLFFTTNGTLNLFLKSGISKSNVTTPTISILEFLAFHIVKFGVFSPINFSTDSIFISLRILTRKKHPKIKLQRLRKIRIWTFGLLVHQNCSFQEVLKLEQIFRKNKLVTGKTPLFVIDPFCSHHSICLDIGFWQSRFEWKWCVFNLSGFN